MMDQRQELDQLRKMKRLQELELKASQGGAQESVAPEPKYGAAQTGVEQFGQGALMGYLPHIQAGAERGIEKGLGLIGVGPDAADERLRAEGFKVPERSYVQARDENISRLETQQKERPVLSGVSQLAGGISSSVGGAGLLGKAVKPAVGALGRIKQAAQVGAVAGAAQNPGDVEGQVNLTQLGDRGKNALTGAMMGAGAQGIGEGVVGAVKGIKKFAEGSKDAAAAYALKQIGASKREFKELYSKDRVNELGDFVRKSGLIKGAPSPEDVISRIDVMKKEAGKTLDDVYSTIKTDKVPVNPGEVVDAMLEKISKGKARPNLGSDASKFDEKMLEVMTDISAKGDSLKDPRVINDLIGEIDGKIRYNKQINELPAVQQGLFEVRDSLRGYLKDLTVKVGKEIKDPGLSQRYAEANKTYGQLKQLENMATNKASSNAVNRLFSLTDYQSGIGGAALGAGQAIASGDDDAIARGLMMGGAAALGNRAARRYGPGLLSKTGDVAGAIGKAASPGLMSNKSPAVAGLLGAQAVDRKNKKKDK